MAILKNLLARVKKIQRKDYLSPCWEHDGRNDSKGYPYHSTGIHAHRHYFSLLVAHVPHKMCVCHICDNPPCCNPGHLFLGTYKDNIRDAALKGRIKSGEQHYTAALTEILVTEIRASNLPYAVLARKFGVNRRTVADAATGVTWKHVPGTTRVPNTKPDPPFTPDFVQILRYLHDHDNMTTRQIADRYHLKIDRVFRVIAGIYYK